VAVAAAGSESRQVPAFAPGCAVERRGEIQHLDPHRVRGGRRQGRRGEQPPHLGQERRGLVHRLRAKRGLRRPEQVGAVQGLRDLEPAEQELLEGAPGRHLAAQRAEALHAPRPVLLIAAGEVSDQERPAELLERRVARLTRPVENVELHAGRRQPVAGRARVRLLVVHDAALGPALAKAVVRVHEVIAPEPRLDAFRVEVLQDREHVLGVELARVLAAAARAERPRPPLVVADVDAARLQQLEVLVHDRRTGSGTTPGSTGSRSRATPCPGLRRSRDAGRRGSRSG
jgi:hypothetical protein